MGKVLEFSHHRVLSGMIPKVPLMCSLTVKDSSALCGLLCKSFSAVRLLGCQVNSCCLPPISKDDTLFLMGCSGESTPHGVKIEPTVIQNPMTIEVLH
ncbi:hypothetical protein AVEN_88994-1 [Araneus ventricosus]|uniref:Uncharacterized protein n=1 Tax=Araneus ventricosus TaxID=182803 RepID=A0A4Y2DIQ4_ARAVE|nr:hypothetical protein AVEN_88994-1 [Araneus ventricosus]